MLAHCVISKIKNDIPYKWIYAHFPVKSIGMIAERNFSNRRNYLPILFAIWNMIFHK